MKLNLGISEFLSERLLRLPIPVKRAVGSMRPISRIVVFGKFPNPTFDYYFAARLAAPGMPNYEFIDVRDFDAKSVEIQGTFVVIIRYSSFTVSRWIAKHHAYLSGVALFVDDDIAAAITSSEASFRYRYRLLRDCIAPLRMLDKVVEKIWVSTEALAGRLKYAQAHVMPPAPTKEVLRLPAFSNEPPDKMAISIAYHATAIHTAEHEFLLPIIAAVLEARPAVKFEVFATSKSANLWLNLCSDRVSVKSPLPWHRYLQDQTRQIDIMLVPVAPSRLNDCRADTKRIDTVRVGAAALFGDCSAYRPAEEGEILLPYDQASWISKIIELVDCNETRAKVAMATRRRVHRMSLQAERGIPSIVTRSTARLPSSSSF